MRGELHDNQQHTGNNRRKGTHPSEKKSRPRASAEKKGNESRRKSRRHHITLCPIQGTAVTKTRSPCKSRERLKSTKQNYTGSSKIYSHAASLNTKEQTHRERGPEVRIIEGRGDYRIIPGKKKKESQRSYLPARTTASGQATNRKESCENKPRPIALEKCTLLKK